MIHTNFADKNIQELKDILLENEKKAHKRAFIWGVFSIVGAIAALLAGYFFSLAVSRGIDNQERSDLLTRVETVALLTNAEDVASLSGSESDLTSPAYVRIKNVLYNLHDVNNGSRFVYYMRSGTQTKKLIFLADSESPQSKEYSPPGQVYEDTSPLEMENYLNATPFVEGPYEDQWGSWVSAYAPVWWQGKLVGIFGMDVSADKWEAHDQKFQKGIFSISILAAAWFVLLAVYIRRARLYSKQNKEIRNYIASGV
jgi:hypothetical protein